jgi:hypothetical protein
MASGIKPSELTEGSDAQLGANGDVTLVLAGNRSCLKRRDGLYCWGELSTTHDRATASARPVRMAVPIWQPKALERCQLTKTRQVSCHGVTLAESRDTVEWMDDEANTVCAKDARGTLRCIYISEDGPPAIGSLVDKPLEHVKQFSAFRWRACAILEDGDVWCRGGFPGLGADDENGWRPIPGIHDARQVVVTEPQGCALHGAAGRVTCWGSNTSGQLGRSGDNGQHTLDLVGIRSLSMGAGHACALGAVPAQGWPEVTCWGSNYDGQLGTHTNASDPVRVMRPSSSTLLAYGENSGVTAHDDRDRVLAQVFPKHLTKSSECPKSWLSMEEDPLAKRRARGEFVPEIVAAVEGSFTARGLRERAYLVRANECDASMANRPDSRWLVVARGGAIVRKVEVSYLSLETAADVDGDGKTELLFFDFESGHGVSTSHAALTRFEGNTFRVLSKLDDVIVNDCSASPAMSDGPLRRRFSLVFAEPDGSLWRMPREEACP